MAKITKIEAKKSELPKRLRVAAYARVSAESERLLHSLSEQVSFYSGFIQKNPEWEYARVYVDSGISGTQTNKRDEFNRMIDDCKAGKIDIILTKSISCFARNTVDLLETVRMLKELNIEVRFEKERINSLSGDEEFMLAILASFAQEESRSTSENIKWAIRRNFKQGKPNSFIIYGYRWNGEKFIVQPDEAEVVKLIFTRYLAGVLPKEIEDELEEKGIKSYRGKKFRAGSIRKILRNEKYTGCLLLQKQYVQSFIDHRSVQNKGELPMYLIENAHEPIISKEMFVLVQSKLEERSKNWRIANPNKKTSCFTSKIKCGRCGKNYSRGVRKRVHLEDYGLWSCLTKRTYGSETCHAKDIPEHILKGKCCDILGINIFDETKFEAKIESIVIYDDYMKFKFKSGDEQEIEWHPRTLSESWTQERRDAQIKRYAERRKEKNANNNNNSGNDQ